IVVSGQVGGFSPQIKLTNNLFFRCAVTLTDSNITGQTRNSLGVAAFNNLFYGGAATIDHFYNSTGSQAWNFYDNFFYQTTISGGAGSGTVNYDYNGYLIGYTQLMPTNTHSRVINDMPFQSGPFGSFYQPSDSSCLNVGSRY